MGIKNIILFAGGAVAGYLVYERFIKKNGEATESFASRSPRRVYTSRAGEFCRCKKSVHGCNNVLIHNNPNKSCDDACKEFCKKKPKKGFIKDW
jgi:hypothetical protein